MSYGTSWSKLITSLQVQQPSKYGMPCSQSYLAGFFSLFLFERSEFLIDTSQKKSLRVCTRVRLLLVLVCGIMYHIRTYLVSARLPKYVYVDTYVPGLHPRPQKKNRRLSAGSGSETHHGTIFLVIGIRTSASFWIFFLNYNFCLLYTSPSPRD